MNFIKIDLINGKYYLIKKRSMCVRKRLGK